VRWEGLTEIVLNQVDHVGVVGFCNLDGYGSYREGDVDVGKRSREIG
jgi:hypothetical protein